FGRASTTVMDYGFGIIRELTAGLNNYLDEKGFASVNDIIGKAVPNVVHWENLNLKFDVKAEIHEEKCIECQLCYTACEDGAHQAIGLPDDPENRIPYIIEENCVGCNLCSLVCPVEGCITMDRKDSGTEQITWK